MSMLHKFTLALSYITSLPLLKKIQSEKELSGLSKYLPAVGLLIGAVLCFLYWLCCCLHSGQLLKGFVVLFAWLAITGCIHLDGWMDAADGLFSQRDRARILEIMKDSRIGSFGAVSGFMLILAKFVCLASLPAAWMLPSLFLIPAWARWTEVYAISVYPYARQEGKGKIWHDTSSQGDLVLAAAVPGLAVFAVCFILHSYAFSLLIALTVLPGIVFAHRINKLLSGHTGDTYGATVEFSEAAALLLLCLFQPAI